MRSRHFAIGFEEFKLLQREPGWKYEYWGGCAHITPRHQTAITRLQATPRQASLPAGLRLRSVQNDDREELVRLFVAAFEDTIHYCDMDPDRIVEAAHENVHGFFSGRRGEPHAASRLAVSLSGPTEDVSIAGAALVLLRSDGGAVLDLLMVRPAWQGRGVATALASAVVTQLHLDGVAALESSYHVGNTASRTWHRAFGFVEEPDVLLARFLPRGCPARADAQHELWRRKTIGDLTDEADSPH